MTDASTLSAAALAGLLWPPCDLRGCLMLRTFSAARGRGSALRLRRRGHQHSLPSGAVGRRGGLLPAPQRGRPCSATGDPGGRSGVVEEGRRRLPELGFAVYAVRCLSEVVTRLSPEYGIKCRGWLPNTDVPRGVCPGEGRPACAPTAVRRLALRRSDHLRVQGAGRWSLPRPHAVDLEDYAPCRRRRNCAATCCAWATVCLIRRSASGRSSPRQRGERRRSACCKALRTGASTRRCRPAC